MIHAELLKRQLAYFVRCVDSVKSSEVIPPHPHEAYYHCSMTPTRLGIYSSAAELMSISIRSGQIDPEILKPDACKLCVIRAVIELTNTKEHESPSLITTQAALLRLFIFQNQSVIHLPNKAEAVVRKRMQNLNESGKGAPHTVSWPSSDSLRFIAGNEEYFAGSLGDISDETGGVHYVCVSVPGWNFQCCFPHLSKTKPLKMAVSEVMRIGMLTAAWQRHSGGFTVSTPVLRVRLVHTGPKLSAKLLAAAAAEPDLELSDTLVPIEGVQLYLNHEDKVSRAFAVRTVTGEEFHSGDVSALAHLFRWMEQQRMGIGESKLGWPRLVEAQKDDKGKYHLEED